jgi:hypothetical protein
MTLRRIVPLTLLVCVLSPTVVPAKIGFRQLTSMHPVAVQRGTKSTVRLRSNFTLDNTYVTFFDKPGIKMTFAETEPIEAPRKGRASVGTPFRFNVEVPDSQPTGVYELRVATRQAVSSISHLLVTDFPVTIETSSNNDSPDAAQSVSLPAAVCGVCERSEDVDCFRFSGEKGQRLTMQVYAQRVTERIHIMLVKNPVYHMDSIITLIGPSGQIVGQNDNFFGADSLLQCVLPETGEYVVKIRDVRYAGSEKYSYCLEISARPFVSGVFPLAVQQGASLDVELIGFELQDSHSLTFSTKAEATIGWKRIRGMYSGGLTNEVPLLVSEHPQLVVGHGSDSLESAASLVIPGGISGRLSKPGMTQYFSFPARKDRYYRFEIEAHRHGLPLDSILEIYDSSGQNLDEADDTRGSPFARWYSKDSRLYFKAPQDGKYFVAVRDLHGRGGASFIYYLSAEPSGEDFELFGEFYYAMLAPGTRMLWFAHVNRLNGFKGPVEMGVEGLPPGVRLTPVTIPQGMNDCAMILSAADDAPIDAALVRSFGKARVARSNGSLEEIVRYGQATCELQSGGGSSQIRWPCHTQIVGVTAPLDLARVEAGPANITLTPGGRVEINVRIVRSPGNSDPVTLAMSHKYYTRSCGDQLPPGVTVSADSRMQLKGNETEAKIILEASLDALPVRQLPIAVMARVYVSYNISTNFASTPIRLTVNKTE